MAYYDFIWDEWNERKIADRGLSRHEVEDVICNPEALDASRSSGRPIALGYTATGRFIAAIYEMVDGATVYPITAYEIENE